MLMEKSVVREYYRWSIRTGILMGMLFPVFSLLYVAHFKSTLSFAILSISCVCAGVIE